MFKTKCKPYLLYIIVGHPADDVGREHGREALLDHGVLGGDGRRLRQVQVGAVLGRGLVGVQEAGQAGACAHGQLGKTVGHGLGE